MATVPSEKGFLSAMRTRPSGPWTMSLLRDGRAQDVPQQRLAASLVLRSGGGRGVQVVALVAHAELRLRQRRGRVGAAAQRGARGRPAADAREQRELALVALALVGAREHLLDAARSRGRAERRWVAAPRGAAIFF
jgi:hypothetical protein